tara:strand:+ start:44 stop:673 length:630 start_codon:yes stop_codon:yes gene_type:complete
MVKRVKLSDGTFFTVRSGPTFSPGGRRLFGNNRRDARRLTDDIIDDINNGMRNAALDIINELAELGPNWDGNFIDEWIAIPLGKGASGESGGVYPYKIDDIPTLAIDKKEAGRVKVFEIVNKSDYAPYALDLVQGRFSPHFAVKRTPNKAPVETGKRDNTRETFRGELTSEPGQGQSTAELDWYNTYTGGGGIGKNMQTGFNKGINFGN